MTTEAFNIGLLNEAIGDAIPDRDAIVAPGKRVTWRDFQTRTRRLANVLRDAGLGCHTERDQLQPWEAGQDFVGLYLYNCPEYLEGMVGAYKSRVAPFNVNYRYVDEELRYIFRDSKAKGLIFHSAFAPTLARVLPDLPPMAVLLQVADDSGEPLLPGARWYDDALAAASDAKPDVTPSPDDLYVVYTGGTTGMPKGVLWRQHDIFFSAMGGRTPGSGDMLGSVAELVERVGYGGMLRLLPAPPFMHAAAHWSAFMMMHQGGTCVIQGNPRALDADDLLTTIERERVTTITIVGDAFARPILDQLKKKTYDLSSLMVFGSGGAILSPSMKQAILEAIPHAMIFDGFGASETGAQGAAVTTAGEEVKAPAFRMDDATCVLDDAIARRLDPGEDAVGWLARAGFVPLGYLGDEAKTKKTYPTVDGVRYAVPGDRAQVMGDGTIKVFGRDSVCINSGGEKIFAEEVEQALKRHPAVYDTVVTGTPNERWGQQVTAVVQLRPGATASDEELRNTASEVLARYKLPKAFVYVDAIVRAPSGKPDYRWAKQTAERGLGGN